MRVPASLVAFFYREITVAGSDHHLAEGVDCQKGVTADFQNAVGVGYQLDFAFFYISSVHGGAGTDFVEDVSAFVFMKNAFFLFPDKEVLFADGEEEGDVFFFYNVAFGEEDAFFLIFDNLGNVVAENVAYCVFGSDFFHCTVFLS